MWLHTNCKFLLLATSIVCEQIIYHLQPISSAMGLATSLSTECFWIGDLIMRWSLYWIVCNSWVILLSSGIRALDYLIGEWSNSIVLRGLRTFILIVYLISSSQRINKDKIGDTSIRLQFNQDELWTRALKYMLTNMKWILIFASRGSVALGLSGDDGSQSPPALWIVYI